MNNTLHEQYPYIGDINLQYGGAFFDLSDWQHGYVNAVKVTDLDFGCGFTGACLIEHIAINGVDDPKRIAESLRCVGATEEELPKEEQVRQLFIADALLFYGHYDPDDSWDNYRAHHQEIVQLEPDGPLEFDGWKADKRLRNTTLEEYVKSVHLKF